MPGERQNYHYLQVVCLHKCVYFLGLSWKVPQTRWCNRTRIYSLTVTRLQVKTQGIGRDMVLLSTAGKNPCFFLASGNDCQSLVSFSASLQHFPLYSHGTLCVCLCPHMVFCFCKDTSHIELGPTLMPSS